MTYSLEQIGDLEDIRTLKHRYFRGIDTADLEMLAQLFTPDIFVDYRGGTYRVRLEGRDNMIEFLANSFHSGAIAMHVGSMPDIRLTSTDAATGIWYMQDIFINLEQGTHTFGVAICRDEYRREDGRWQIARTEYDRTFEIIQPLASNAKITTHHLGSAGRKPQDRTSIDHVISWTTE